MAAVEDALASSGSGADVSVFVALPTGTTPELDVTVGNDRPTPSVYPLEQDEPRTLPDLDVVEVDAHFAVLPADLEAYVRTLLQRSLDLGAVVAWCAFEGSFHFDHLLTDDIARQVYGVATPTLGVRTALDDATLGSPAWAATVRDARAGLAG